MEHQIGLRSENPKASCHDKPIFHTNMQRADEDISDNGRPVGFQRDTLEQNLDY